MNATILLVEDNAQNRYLATFLLENSGCRVLHAHTGLEAISAATRQRPDLVLMDIQMPEMDGYEAASALRKIPGMEKVPFIAVTSYAMMGDRERSLERGFSGYIEKPIDTATFIAQISQFFPGKEDLV